MDILDKINEKLNKEVIREGKPSHQIESKDLINYKLKQIIARSISGEKLSKALFFNYNFKDGSFITVEKNKKEIGRFKEKDSNKAIELYNSI